MLRSDNETEHAPAAPGTLPLDQFQGEIAKAEETAADPFQACALAMLGGLLARVARLEIEMEKSAGA